MAKYLMAPGELADARDKAELALAAAERLRTATVGSPDFYRDSFALVALAPRLANNVIQMLSELNRAYALIQELGGDPL